MNINCPQCGAGCEIDYNQHYAACKYCGSSLAFDTAGLCKHFLTLPKIKHDEHYITTHLKTFLSSNEIKSSFAIKKYEAILYPFWCHTKNNGEIIFLPASSVYLFDEKVLHLEAGEFIIFDEKILSDFRIVDSDIPLASSIGQLKKTNLLESENIKETILVHFPFCKIFYDYQQTEYEILLDLITEEFHAETFPPTVSGSITKKFIGVCLLLVVIFTLAGIVVDNFGHRFALMIGLSIPTYFILSKYLFNDE